MSAVATRHELALVVGACDGDEESAAALVRLYEPVVRFIGSHYFAPGLSREDLLQVGRLAVLEAAEQHRPSRGMTFASFTRMVVERRVQTAVKEANRGKHSPLNRSLSLATPVDDEGDDGTLADVLPGPGYEDPAEQVAASEALAEVVTRAQTLSRLERRVLAGTLSERAFSAIALELGVSEKAVDNALQRAKAKLAGPAAVGRAAA